MGHLFPLSYFFSSKGNQFFLSLPLSLILFATFYWLINICRHVIRLIVAFKMNFPILLYKIDCKKWWLETQRFILFLFFHSYWNKQRVFEYLDFWWANWKKLQQIDNSGFELSFPVVSFMIQPTYRCSMLILLITSSLRRMQSSVNEQQNAWIQMRNEHW